ncbi:MAG: Maf family nucleotide pyrophosphatase [Sulfurimicrobium sp.]|nr:Maf family nucleotide pyrophosphatase [Sulfurimicrobium sp.]
MELVLASTSPYRRELLERLKIPFTVFAPEVDETPLPAESPEQTATRLAEAKARVGAARFPDALIIGSDQVATLDGQQLGKPHTHENATRQLRMMRGKRVVFNTALCLYNSRSGSVQNRLVPFTVTFRDLTDAQIEHYLVKEQPYNCAGSAKSEGLGIALIARMEGDDPNALIGLPLIALIDMLHNESFAVI